MGDEKDFGTGGYKKLIPHRYHFLLVDRIIDLKVGEEATGIKVLQETRNFLMVISQTLQ